MSFFREMFGLPVERQTRPKGMYVAGRKYNAADVGNLFSDFKGTTGSADQDLLEALETMRKRSRDLERNEPLVRGFLDDMRTNVIGPKGMRLQVKALNNRDEKLDTRGNAKVEEAWHEFTRKGNCSACGQFSMRTLSELALSSTLRDGESFFQLVFGKEFKHGIALNPFEPDLIDEKKNARLKNGNRIKMGVELNQYGRPIAFWKKRNHPGDQSFSSISANSELRIPAENIIHVKLMRRFGQTRGEPTLAPVITTFKMVNGHREAELVAARIAASKMGFFTSRSGEDFPVDGDGDDGAQVPVTDVSPGTLWQLPPDMEFTPFDPSHPSSAFADFQKNVLMSTAAGLGVSYESLTGDTSGASWSSLRHVALDERDFYTEVQEWFKEQFIWEVYSRWINHAFDFGIIDLPMKRAEKFLRASTFRCRGWKWVDPVKEVNAVKEAAHLGIMSLTEASEQLGYDLEETWAQIVREKEMAEAMGLQVNFEPFGSPPGAQIQAPEQTEEEEDGQGDT